jgi:hypothetical protein
MGKFEEDFDDPMYMTDGSYAIRGDISRQTAALLISSEIGEVVDPDSLETDRVRYGLPPEEVEWDRDGPCWYNGAHGKGSRPVWVLSKEKR